MNARVIALMMVLAGAAAQTAQADVASFGAMQDCAIYEDPNGALANGSGEFMFVGNTGTGVTRRTLLQFDLNSLPLGSVINSVSLILHMSQTSTGATDVSLHTLQTAWTEGPSDAPTGEGSGTASLPGDATWIHTSYNTSFWNNPGGDFNALASAMTSVNAIDFYTWSSGQMVSDVQEWLTNPSMNFGWLLIGNETLNNTSKRFDSSESLTANFRPVLMIDYTPVPAPSVLALMSLAVIARGRCRR